MYVYGFHLLNKFFRNTSLKQIIITSDSDIMLVYTKLKHGGSYDYKTVKQCIKIDVKGNVMKILENGKYIAKVYRNTLKNKNDWEWMINYFNNK